MAKKVYDTEMSARLNIPAGSGTYVFTTTGSIVAANDYAIYESASGINDTIDINGVIEGSDGQGGILSYGRNLHLNIGGAGEVSGGTGLDIYGANPVIDNGGYIHSSIGYALISESSHFTLTNSGLIEGASGIQVTGDVISITNEAGGIIKSAGNALRLIADAGDQTRVVNHGLITAPYGTGGYIVGASDDTLINRGRIIGSVNMDDGNDVLDNRDGLISGTLAGGEGNDVFLTSDAIDFYGGGGIDTVKSTVDYTLYDETERLYLLGKANIDGTGNAGANRFTGNSGNNVLLGLQGDDVLDGGAGNDVLNGGIGSDRFIFSTGYDHDTITTLQQGTDHVDVSRWKAVAGFKDLKNNHATDHGHNVWITAGDDRLIISDLHKADLHASDFIF